MIELSPEQLAQLADMLADRLRGVLPDQPTPSTTTGINGALATAQTVADALGVDRTWVYGHASELGGRKLGSGDRPRWRFDLASALAAGIAKPTNLTTTVVTSVPAPRRRAVNASVPLMAIRGER